MSETRVSADNGGEGDPDGHANVSYALRGPLAIITLRRAEALNALTLDMIADIARLARNAESDPAVTAICITGEGRGFCAGIDMSVLTAHAGQGAPETNSDGSGNPALFSFLLEISKPVIAAINGVTAGGGFVLAMMCDLRFMSEEANLTTVFTRRGLVAEHGTSWLLPRMIGLSRALDILWSSRKIDGAEAYRLGLADRLTPAEELMMTVESYVGDLDRQVSPRALAVIKAQVHRHLATGFEEAARDSDALMGEALRHPDATEGAASFVERRPPRFARWHGN